MPSNLPYSSASNPTGAVPVRETVSSPSGATLVRFVQTNPFDTNDNGVVDRVDGMDALAGSVLALGTLPARVSALEVSVATPITTLPRLGINTPSSPYGSALGVRTPNGQNIPFTITVEEVNGYSRVFIGVTSGGGGYLALFDAAGIAAVVLDGEAKSITVGGRQVAILENGVVPGRQLPTLAGLKHQLLALTDPTGADRTIPGGWSVGSLWVNVAAGRVWFCVNGGLAGNAVWRDLTATQHNLTATRAPNALDTQVVGGWTVGSLWSYLGSTWVCTRDGNGPFVAFEVMINATRGYATWIVLGAPAASTPTRSIMVVQGLGDPAPVSVANVEWVARAIPVSVGGSPTLFTLEATMVVSTLQLFRNGLLLEPAGADYTDTSGGSFTLIAPLGVTERLRAFYYRTPTTIYAGS